MVLEARPKAWRGAGGRATIKRLLRFLAHTKGPLRSNPYPA
jgi:hypothetical protein